MFRKKDLIARVSGRLFELEEKVKSDRELSDAKFNCVFESLSLLKGKENRMQEDGRKKEEKLLEKKGHEGSMEGRERREKEPNEEGAEGETFMSHEQADTGEKEEGKKSEKKVRKHFTFEEAKGEKRILLIWKGPNWENKKIKEYLRNLIGTRERFEVVKALNNSNKQWIIFDRKQARDKIWEEKETFRRERIFYVDEFLTYIERKRRFEMLGKSKVLETEGKIVKVENRVMWVEEERRGAWYKWCPTKQDLIRESAWLIKKDGEWKEEKEDLLDIDN